MPDWFDETDAEDLVIRFAVDCWVARDRAVGQPLGQTIETLIFLIVASLLPPRLFDCQPHQRRGPSMAREQREHDGRVSVGVELRPVHRYHDALASAHQIGYPLGEQRPHLNALVRQQPVDLFDRMLGEQTTCVSQALADQMHRQRSATDDAQRGVRQRVHPFRVHIDGEQ